MKRFLATLLAVLMVCTLCACGAEKPADNSDKGGDTTTSATTTTEGTTTTTTLSDCPPLPSSTTTEAEDTTTTEEETTTTEAEVKDTTTTTKKPTSTTVKPTSSTRKPPITGFIPGIPSTTEAEKPQKNISILAVGNSFSVDAMRHHLYDMLKAAGYDNVTLGILYVGGCSIGSHYTYILSGNPVYQFQLNTSGSWTYVDGCEASRAFNQTDWDIVTVQQVSGESGMPEKYERLQNLLDLVKSKCRGAKIYWHMTWAYQQDSTHSSFPHYNSDQMTMYAAIISTTRSKVEKNADIRGIIPAGTAIQNLRTSSLGDTLTADGYHLKDTYGDYTAALTWYCFLTNEKADTMTYRPASIADHFDEIAESVDNAIANPYKVTACK